MAEIDVKIKGDDADFKKKLAESAAASAEFATAVKEQMATIKESAADVLSESGFGGLGKGITGGQVAMVAFGAAVVEGFKHAVEAATDFEKNVKSLSFALGTATAGQAEGISKWVESVSGAMGTIEEDQAAFKKLIQAGFLPEDAKTKLIDIQNIAAKTGSSIESVTAAIAEMKASGEIPKGFFRENTAIAALVKQMLGPEIPKPGEMPATGEAADEKLMTRVTAKGGADWFMRNVFPMIAPGGQTAAIRAEVGGTAAGQWADVKVQFTELYEEIGTELLPTVKDFAKEFKADLPAITETLKGFAAGLENVLQSMGKFAKPAGDILGPLFHPQTIAEIQEARARPADIGWLNNAMKVSWDEMVREFSAATQKHAESAEDMQRALHPY